MLLNSGVSKKEWAERSAKISHAARKTAEADVRRNPDPERYRRIFKDGTFLTDETLAGVEKEFGRKLSRSELAVFSEAYVYTILDIFWAME